MTVFGTVLKIDSIKKRMRKLTGMEEGCAKWMTNVRNERGKILVTVLTDSESTRPLQPMANELVKRFEIRQRENSLLLHLDRACIKGCIKGCHFRFTTFLVLFVLEPLVQVWVRFSLIHYASLFFALGVFLHIVYPALLVIFTFVLCLIHSVSLTFVLALYLSATFPWSYHHLPESMTFVSSTFTICRLAFVQF